MALQDLTPQLRTRLSRMERAVGWFVFLATALLVFGFVYYIYHTAQRKGWFIQKVNYQTSLNNATGLKVGDHVQLMGFDVGEITRVEANGPYDVYGVTVFFYVKAPYFGYLWSDSTAKVAAADFLGKRYLEVTKGLIGLPTIQETTNKVAVGLLKATYLKQRLGELTKQGKSTDVALGELNTASAADRSAFYTNLTRESVYWLEPAESPALTERLEKIVSQVELALPDILALTNQISVVLSNSSLLTSNLNAVAVNIQPAITNLTKITTQLREPGAFGEWLLSSNMNQNLDNTLANLDTNLPVLFESAGQSLENLANLTSNLNAQVQANTNLLGGISKTVTDTDDLVQGLKRHWLLRSTFKTNAPAKPKK